MPHRVAAVIFGLIAVAGPARAGDGDPDAPCPAHRPGTPITEAQVACAPPPEEAAGHIVPPPQPREHPPLVRAAEPLQRGLVRVVLAPVRLALWAEDRYHVAARARAAATGEQEAGVFPVARWDGGRRVSVGFGYVDRDLLGSELSLRASAGTDELVHLAALVDSKELIDGVRIDAGVRYRNVASSTFYGYGDVDAIDDTAPPTMPVDPIGQGGHETQFSHRETITRSRVLVPVADRVSAAVGASLRWTEAGPRRSVTFDEPSIEQVYQTDRLPGWDGVEATRAEASLLIDRRRTRDRLQSKATPSAGWIAQVYGGWQQGLGPDLTAFSYGGVDALGLVDLYGGDRVLSLRVTVDGTVGDLDRIPFNELPSLGGSQTLRGYQAGRFRDRWSAATSLEYAWPVTKGLSGVAFVDAGRVARVASSLLDDPPRWSGGLGAQVFTARAMVARASLAASEEDVILRIELEPAFGRRPREVTR